VLATLEDLDEPALERILVEPKNALVNQYQRLFERRVRRRAQDRRRAGEAAEGEGRR
jgi:ATP-dependent protease Clp ATPase subunit